MRFLLAAVPVLLILSGCLSQVSEDEVAGAREGLSAAERRVRAGDIRDAAAARGMTQGWLLAGVADAETNLSHCWSELTWSCQGPTSPDCGGGPIVAGAADGPCSERQGGLGMFQFDAGDFDDTLAREGSRILTVSGNTDAAVDFVVDMVVRSTFISGVDTAADAITWMNGVRTDNGRLDQWIQTVVRYYNGCPPSGSCWSERVGRYQRYAVNVHDEMGTSFWDTSGTGGGSTGGGMMGGGTDGGTMTSVSHAAEFVTQTFPRAGSAFALAPGEEVFGYFEMLNTGTDTWTPGFTFFGTVEPRDGDSALYGPDWTAPHRAASVEAPVSPGEIGRFALTLRAPYDPGVYRQAFNIVEEGVGHFVDVGRAPRDGDIAVEVTVSRDVVPGSGGGSTPEDPWADDPFDPAPSGDDPPPVGHPGDGRLTGCSAGGDGAPTGFFLSLLLLAALRKRRGE